MSAEFLTEELIKERFGGTMKALCELEKMRGCGFKFYSKNGALLPELIDIARETTYNGGVWVCEDGEPIPTFIDEAQSRLTAYLGHLDNAMFLFKVLREDHAEAFRLAELVGVDRHKIKFHEQDGFYDDAMRNINTRIDRVKGILAAPFLERSMWGELKKMTQ